MTKLFIALFLLASAGGALSQSVGINNATPHSSAVLDVKSTTKGVLVPRMNSVQRGAITTPAAGLLVYDTDTNSFWFYNGSAWSNLSASGSVGWALGGNSGTNPSTQFVGTTDNQPLRLRTNNGWAGELNPLTGNFSIGSNAGAVHTSGHLNSAFGSGALAANTTANNNVAIGDSTLFKQNGVGTNVAVGTHSMFSNTVGNANTALGPYALFNNLDGSFNTSVGLNTMANNISGNQNTAVGSRALQFNTASYNTATGAFALRFNSSGDQNTANGYSALMSTTFGSGNTAVGAYSLGDNTAGYENAAFGSHALSFNTIANDNTAIGSFALASNSAAEENTAVGSHALYTQNFSNGGSRYRTANVAIGAYALFSNNPASGGVGSLNVAVGNNALYTNSTGYENTAVGEGSLYSNTAGTDNVALGTGALYGNISGVQNLSAGVRSLNFNSSGSDNVSLGTAAMRGNTSGGHNTAVGTAALFNVTTGSGNIAIGAYSGIASGSPGITNTISIGNDGILNAASNQAFFGNLSTVWNGGNKTWSTYSDARMKTSIAADVVGLPFIMRLHPVTYRRNIHEITRLTGNKETADFPGKYDIEKIKETGFLAQEVEKAAKDAGYDFSGVGVPHSEKQMYTLSYEQFVVPLVKGMQEQQAMIESLKKEVEDLKMIIKKGN